TLAIITEIIVRLVPRPAATATLRATFPSVRDAVEAVAGIVRARVVPAANELIDRDALAAIAAARPDRELAPPGTTAMLLIDVDGAPEQVPADLARVAAACQTAGASELRQAAGADDRTALWDVRRELSYALRSETTIKLNNDVVVPKSRIPDLLALAEDLGRGFGLPVACFGHVGDGNIHVNILVPRNDPDAMARGQQAVAALFAGVIRLEGAITGEHGVGFTKAPFLEAAIGADAIALMRRIKSAFDPAGILNPGKIFPDEVAASRLPGF
ncbi:MAG TPA: FAD-linked oxidase C-terminal domain-containing protein, partial [Thermomicrobiales bacterium]|nr:FAD-linked oxidase C-terminal domain-containing protein [Thermomicrobiales bacterium]